jgi:hypothetical protein
MDEMGWRDGETDIFLGCRDSTYIDAMLRDLILHVVT